MMVLCEIAAREETGRAKLARNAVIALLPVERHHVGEIPLDAADVVDRAEELRGAGADRRDGVDARLADEALADLCRDRDEVPGGSHRVVSDEQLVDRVLERRP